MKQCIILEITEEEIQARPNNFSLGEYIRHKLYQAQKVSQPQKGTQPQNTIEGDTQGIGDPIPLD